jgi:hypothetical protein
MDEPDLTKIESYITQLEEQLLGVAIYEPQKRLMLAISALMLKHLVRAVKGEEPPPPMDVPNVI